MVLIYFEYWHFQHQKNKSLYIPQSAAPMPGWGREAKCSSLAEEREILHFLYYFLIILSTELEI